MFYTVVGNSYNNVSFSGNDRLCCLCSKGPCKQKRWVLIPWLLYKVSGISHATCILEFVSLTLISVSHPGVL